MIPALMPDYPAHDGASSLHVRDHELLADDGGRSVLVEVSRHGSTPLADVILLPGMFTARGFWLSPRQIGLAAHLAECGMRCWIFERRGIGAAAANPKGVRLGMEEARHLDLPAAWRFLDQRAGTDAALPRFMVGHSFGGVLAARALADNLPQAECAGLVIFAAQCEAGKAPLHPPGSWLISTLVRILGRLPARLAGLGPTDEPRDAALDGIAWTTQARRDGRWLERLRKITVPVLAIASAGDTIDPPSGCERFAQRIASADKCYTLLSRAGGWAEDYSHPGMVVSRNAREEVWPYVSNWLQQRLATTS